MRFNSKLITTHSLHPFDLPSPKYSSSSRLPKSGYIYYYFLLLSCLLLLLWNNWTCYRDDHHVVEVVFPLWSFLTFSSPLVGLFVHGSITGSHTASITNILANNPQFTSCGSQNMYSTPLVATFDAPNMQQGKMLLSSSPYSFAIGEDYFASCPIGMTSLNNTVKVNGQLVMNLQTSCQCSLSYYQSLKKQEVPIVSYVLLNGTGNTLTIDLNPFNAGVDQRMQNIYMSFYEMAIDDVIIDLKIGNVPTRLDLLSPSSFAQVQTEPFTSTALTNMSNSFSSYVTVNNNAIDVAGNVTFKISSPSSLDNRLIFDLTSIKKINLMTGLSNTVFPQVLNSNTSTQVIYQLIGVNLSYNEQLQIFYTVQTAYEPSSNTKFSLYFSVDGVQSSSQVYEAYASDNTISTTLNVYKTSKMESFFNQYNSGYSLLATVSDLAYFKYVPQIGAMDSKCWIQLNILSQSFNGLIHIFSTKTSKQYSIPVSSSGRLLDEHGLT